MPRTLSVAPAAPSGAAPEAPEDEHPPGLPLGPDSLTWRYFGDTRGLLTTLRAAVLQTMHPTISAGLIDHSDVFRNQLARLARSAHPIVGVVYDEDWGATARWVRDVHRPVKGEHRPGVPYRALDGEAYFWAHSTFFESQIATQDLFGTPLTLDEKRRLYREAITWYRRYGLSMRPVPPDYDEWLVYWHRMFDEVLRPTPVALMGIRSTPGMPAPAPALASLPLGLPWAAMKPFVNAGLPWLAKASLPPQAREILAARWTGVDELRLRALQAWVRATWPVVPGPMRQAPPARAAYAREARKARAAAR